MIPGKLKIADFSYILPEDRIARFPLEKRDLSKLLYYRNGAIENRKFEELPQLLIKEDLLVFNDTKVIKARITFQKETGSTIEIFCLEPADLLDPLSAFQQTGSSRWKVLIGNAKRWKEKYISKEVLIEKETIFLSACIEEKGEDHFIVRFEWKGNQTFSEIMEHAGKIPLPPYLNREADEEDSLRYQTVYARHDGSVAAPTAGLHFTDAIITELHKKQIETERVTLHVSAGTFKPVKAEKMEEHIMHEEKIFVNKKTIAKFLDKKNTGRIIAVGTTSLRTIESLYFYGASLLAGNNTNFIDVGQWEPYSIQEFPVQNALEAVLHKMAKEGMNYISGTTRIIIAPGYKLKIADGLITNFHQPGSTLLLLVAALCGDNWRTVYTHALENDYRFLSYGDSSLLLP